MAPPIWIAASAVGEYRPSRSRPTRKTSVIKSMCVIAGQASFYGEGDKLVAKLDKNDMLMIPRGTPYWFESSSKEPLVIIRFSARAQNTMDKRIDYTERKPKPREVIPDTYFQG